MRWKLTRAPPEPPSPACSNSSNRLLETCFSLLPLSPIPLASCIQPVAEKEGQSVPLLLAFCQPSHESNKLFSFPQTGLQRPLQQPSTREAHLGTNMSQRRLFESPEVFGNRKTPLKISLGGGGGTEKEFTMNFFFSLLTAYRKPLCFYFVHQWF